MLLYTFFNFNLVSYSTFPQLLLMFSRHLTGAIFVDLTKAFDLVDHRLLLDTLHAIGLSRRALLWCNPFVHNRRYCVLRGCESDLLAKQRGEQCGN